MDAVPVCLISGVVVYRIESRTHAESQESPQTERQREVDLDADVARSRSTPDVTLIRLAGVVILYHRRMLCWLAM